MDSRDGVERDRVGDDTAVDRAARVLVGREVHWTLVVLVLLVLLAVLPVTPLRALGSLVLVGFDVPQHALLPGLTGVAYWAGVGAYLYVLSLVAGAVVRVLGRRFVARERHANPRTRPRRSRLPSTGALVSAAMTLGGLEVVGTFVVLVGLAYAGLQGVPVLAVPGGVVLTLLDWAVVGPAGSTLALASTVVASYVVALGVGNLLYLMRRP